MQVKDVMKNPIISVSPQDPITRALAAMKSHSVHQVLVMDQGRLHGIVELKTMVTKKQNPQDVKAEHVCKKVSTVSSSLDIGDAVHLILNSGLHALPVVDRGAVVGILSETDLMNSVTSQKKAASVMSLCETVNKRATLGLVKHCMLESNISRVPVVEGNKIVGVVRTLDLIAVLEANPLEGAVSQQKPRGKKEVKQIDDLGIDSFISPATVVSKDVDLQDVAKLLKTNEEVFIADAGQFYVVTPKDVLEAEFLQPQPPVHVQFSNLGNEDPYIAYQIEQSVAGFGDKMKVMLPGLQSCAFHLERHYHGGKVKYSLRARMYSSLGMTVARAWGWDPFTATQEVLKKLEREAVGRKGKVHDRNERRRYDTKRR